LCFFGENWKSTLDDKLVETDAQLEIRSPIYSQYHYVGVGTEGGEGWYVVRLFEQLKW